MIIGTDKFNMKYILFLSVFLCVNLYADETSKYLKINKTLFYLENSQWVDYIRRIKNDEEIPNYFSLKEPTPYERDVLLRFNLPSFEKGLRGKVDEVLSENEVSKANKLLSNPFVSKIVKQINYNYIKEVPLEKRAGKIHPKLRPLIISIYNILGHDSLVKLEHSAFMERYEEKEKARAILQKTNDILRSNPNQKYSLNQFREFYFIDLYERMRLLTIPELREFLRIVKTEKEFLKLNQVLLGFSYGFIFNIREEISKEKARKDQLGL